LSKESENCYKLEEGWSRAGSLLGVRVHVLRRAQSGQFLHFLFVSRNSFKGLETASLLRDSVTFVGGAPICRSLQLCFGSGPMMRKGPSLRNMRMVGAKSLKRLSMSEKMFKNNQHRYNQIAPTNLVRLPWKFQRVLLSSLCSFTAVLRTAWLPSLHPTESTTSKYFFDFPTYCNWQRRGTFISVTLFAHGEGLGSFKFANSQVRTFAWDVRRK